jgi:hypothetical protein
VIIEYATACALQFQAESKVSADAALEWDTGHDLIYIAETMTSDMGRSEIARNGKQECF